MARTPSDKLHNYVSKILRSFYSNEQTFSVDLHSVSVIHYFKGPLEYSDMLERPDQLDVRLQAENTLAMRRGCRIDLLLHLISRMKSCPDFLG